MSYALIILFLYFMIRSLSEDSGSDATACFAPLGRNMVARPVIEDSGNDYINTEEVNQ